MNSTLYQQIRYLLFIAKAFVCAFFQITINLTCFYAKHLYFLLQVVDLIKSDTITVLSEEKIYESVIAWINFNSKVSITIRQNL